MVVKNLPVASIHRYQNNPRKNADAVAGVVASIREFGFLQPLVVDVDRVIIVGDTRFLAALDLGLEKVPCIVASTLTPAQARAYRLADNKLGEAASWDDSRLFAEVAALIEADFDTALTGFTEPELSSLEDRVTAAVEPERDLDDTAPLPEETTVQPGDLYVCGPHRVLCADSTDVDAWARLLDGDAIGCVWTDPPYAVDYVGKTRRRLKIQGDGKDPLAIRDLLRGAFGAMLPHCRAGAPWYVAAPPGPAFLAFAEVLTEFEVWRQTLVWVKDQFVLGHSDMHYQHEPVLHGMTGPGAGFPAAADPSADDAGDAGDEEDAFASVLYGWAPGAHRWYGGRARSTVLQHAKPARNEDHPTKKPVALVADCLQWSTLRGEIVADAFAGSGTTLVACEHLGRVARVVEKDPRYAAGILARWEQLSGRPPVRVE